MPTDDAIVLATVSCFADDRAALERFLDATGLDVRAIRTGMSDGSLRAGVLHHLTSDEELLIAVATHMGVAPGVVAQTILQATSPGEDRPFSAGSPTRASASTPRVRPRG